MIYKWLSNNLQYALDVCVALLIFFVPLSPAFPNILMAPASLLTLFILLNKRTFKQPVFWYLLIVFALSLLFQSFLVNDFLSELDFQRRLFAGILIFTLVSNTKRQWLLEKAFWLGLSIAIIYSLGLIIYKSIYISDFSIGVGKNVHNALIMERPYFAFATVLGNYLIFRNIRCHKISKYYYALAFLFGSFCFLISAKLGIALHIILLFHHAYRSIDKLKVKHVFLSLISLTIIAFALIKNPYLKERLRISDNWESTIRKIKVYEPRFVIWPCSYESVTNNGLAGFHSHQKLKEELVKCYANRIKKKGKRDYYLNAKFNTHNQYLDSLLAGGFVTFLLLMAAILWPFINYNYYDQLFTIFMLFIAFFMVENVLLRQTGCFLFGIFAALGYNYDQQKN